MCVLLTALVCVHGSELHVQLMQAKLIGKIVGHIGGALTGIKRRTLVVSMHYWVVNRDYKPYNHSLLTTMNTEHQRHKVGGEKLTGW